jgi:hypothetical protein
VPTVPNSIPLIPENSYCHPVPDSGLGVWDKEMNQTQFLTSRLSEGERVMEEERPKLNFFFGGTGV